MKKWLLLITLLFSLLLVVIVILANLDQFPQPIKYLYDFPGGDKVGHFALFGLTRRFPHERYMPFPS